MHDYSIRNKSKRITYYWISAISIMVTPVVINFLEKLFAKIPILNKLYNQINLLGFSFSAVLIFTILWFLFSKMIWKLFAKTKIIKIPDISGNWFCAGEGRKYLDSNNVNSWKGIIVSVNF